MSYQSKTMNKAGVSVKGSLSDHNLSIPLRVQWRYEIVPDWSVFVYTGPSFDIGVGGKIKQSGEAFGESASFEESIYDKEYGFRRFNMLWSRSKVEFPPAAHRWRLGTPQHQPYGREGHPQQATPRNSLIHVLSTDGVLRPRCAGLVL